LARPHFTTRLHLQAIHAKSPIIQSIDSAMGSLVAGQSVNRPLCKNVGMHPKSDGLLESSLYVQNVAASVRFYAMIFG
jgi:hypothetical protein